VATSKTPTVGRIEFMPALVAGPSKGAGTQMAQVATRQLQGQVEATTIGRLNQDLKRGRVIGALFLLPRDAEDTVGEIEQVLHLAGEKDPALPVVVVGDGLTPDQVAAAFRLGAEDVVFAGDGEPEIPEAIRQVVARRAARAAGALFEDREGMPRVIGSSPVMQEAARLVERVAPSDATVLILGESGTGKELIAKAIHVLSRRAKGPFIAINCAAIPETLLENELFGHEKGSYTGASSTAIGKVEAAEKGTLFLDEIGEMPMALQAKILRLLQDRTYDRIGGTRTRTADIRIVAATNKELKQEVANQRFREDLYYRLSVVPITLPGLRDRPGDVPVLAQAILDRLAEKLGRPALRMTDEAKARLLSYRWPGNVRELENELERAAVLAPSDEIRAQDLELRARVDDPDASALARLAPMEGRLEDTLEAVTRTTARIRIGEALARTSGDRARAAEILGIEEDELNGWIESMA
jgi:DNA-binding NtrC family response regulator